MAREEKRVFVRKPYNSQLYKWSPQETDKKAKKNDGLSRGNTFCNATPFSQGEDWRTSYAYAVVITDGIQHREAYVECDYVQ